MDRALLFLHDLSGTYVYLAEVFAGLIVVETILPVWGKQPSLTSRLKAGVFWAVGMAVTGALGLVLRPVLDHMHAQPLWPVLVPGSWPVAVRVVCDLLLAAFIGDFFYYWSHRAQHAIPFLWRFHAVHHSVREMSGVTAYHHVTEFIWRALLYALPLSLITKDPFGLPFIGLYLNIQGHYLHSNTRLNLGPLGVLFQDNRFHRLHHSILSEHHDRNFGVFTTLWDVLFRTAVFPKPGEWPETGVADVPEPAGVGDYLLGPMRPKPRAITSSVRALP